MRIREPDWGYWRTRPGLGLKGQKRREERMLGFRKWGIRVPI